MASLCRQVLAASVLLIAQASLAQRLEGFWGADLRWYPQSADPYGSCCEDMSLGITLAPRYHRRLSEGWQLNLDPYVRFESDGEMAYADLRQANVSYHSSSWYLSVGFNEIYWGVTETYQPVNVVNQYDTHLGPQVTDKLGQPMVEMRYFPTWGELQLLVMPYHRDRPYRDREQRLALPVDVSDDATFPDGERQPEYAGRLTRYVGALELGVSAFMGNSREPVLIMEHGNYVKSYSDLAQLGLDTLWAGDDTLIKAEIVRKWEGENVYYSSVAGLEYSFYNFSGNDATLGLILEYSYDNRPFTAPPTLYNNDVFVGTRWMSNNIAGTECLVAGIYDLDSHSQIYRLQASSRLNSQVKLLAEAWWFSEITAADPAHYLRSDSYLSIGVEYYF